jgi:hypothetical protein
VSFDPAEHYRRRMREGALRAAGVPLTHGRTRRRWAERVALILYVVAGLIFFVAWVIMLAYLILIVTN